MANYFVIYKLSDVYSSWSVMGLHDNHENADVEFVNRSSTGSPSGTDTYTTGSRAKKASTKYISVGVNFSGSSGTIWPITFELYLNSKKVDSKQISSNNPSTDVHKLYFPTSRFASGFPTYLEQLHKLDGNSNIHYQGRKN